MSRQLPERYAVGLAAFRGDAVLFTVAVLSYRQRITAPALLAPPRSGAAGRAVPPRSRPVSWADSPSRWLTASVRWRPPPPSGGRGLDGRFDDPFSGRCGGPAHCDGLPDSPPGRPPVALVAAGAVSWLDDHVRLLYCVAAR
ncbi:hypothetical protein [Micromonospora sp. CPCC 205556]|uniref:hypothetical protein n=1 Tax=Micromonospora sp. CPCC 205556 TaxID=3122398 RepID=UPI002FF020B3